MKSVSPSIFLLFLSSALLLAAGSALSSQVSSPAKANPVIKAMANGMTLFKPVFAAEAKLQASILGSKVTEQEVAQEIAAEIKSSPIVVYTYGLSPFSTEAVSILEKTGYSFNKIELGAEWFLLNGKDSVKRVLLSEFVENGATSLPKVFVGGKCIGGCAELAQSVESGEFDTLVNSGKKQKKLFPFL
jgi:glutaredoxin-related protein